MTNPDDMDFACSRLFREWSDPDLLHVIAMREIQEKRDMQAVGARFLAMRERVYGEVVPLQGGRHPGSAPGQGGLRVVFVPMPAPRRNRGKY